MITIIPSDPIVAASKTILSYRLLKFIIDCRGRLFFPSVGRVEALHTFGATMIKGVFVGLGPVGAKPGPTTDGASAPG